eukprot:TRINITY_DN4558_c0_g3_i1.p1 TRINITY_DN4558_c0_g3~~TRINITY_DN4558_c0_g3_i1.p1  ORF type:complete len:166 (-),score=20.11 TRINITY_DN4558_c0_g3_i1:381-878(-)
MVEPNACLFNSSAFTATDKAAQGKMLRGIMYQEPSERRRQFLMEVGQSLGGTIPELTPSRSTVKFEDPPPDRGAQPILQLPASGLSHSRSMGHLSLSSTGLSSHAPSHGPGGIHAPRPIMAVKFDREVPLRTPIASTKGMEAGAKNSLGNGVSAFYCPTGSSWLR